MKTIIIGLGNPLLGDDGIGWRIAQQVEQRLASWMQASWRENLSLEIAPVEVDCLSVGGLSLMEHLIGYDHAILIDAITTSDAPQGTLFSFRVDDLPEQKPGAQSTPNHLASVHDATLLTALQLGRHLGAHLPAQIDIVAIEACKVYDFSEELSAQVASAVSPAVQRVFELLKPT